MQTQKQNQSISCSICIDQSATASVDGCPHKFCLKCIRKWSKTKNTCPLCRQQFNQIIKGNRHYKVDLPKPVEMRPATSNFVRQRVVQRRIIYVPIMLDQPPIYYFYSPNTMSHQSSDSIQTLPFQYWSFNPDYSSVSASTSFFPSQ